METEPMTRTFGDCASPVTRYRSGVLVLLVVGYVALLPYLFEAGDRLNFAPSDCFLLLVPLLAAAQLKYRESAWSIWHIGILLIFALGSFVAVLRFGELDRYELLNKDAGLLLPFLSYAAITSLVNEWDDMRRILRVFILSVVVENLLAIGGFHGSLLLRHSDTVYPLRGASALGDASRSECLRRPSRGCLGDLRGGFMGPRATVPVILALVFKADPDAGNSVYLFALGMAGPRLGFPASLQ